MSSVDGLTTYASAPCLLVPETLKVDCFLLLLLPPLALRLVNRLIHVMNFRDEWVASE